MSEEILIALFIIIILLVFASAIAQLWFLLKLFLVMLLWACGLVLI